MVSQKTTRNLHEYETNEKQIKVMVALSMVFNESERTSPTEGDIAYG